MKTKLNLAVAAALLAGASSANAGIMIPAGDWTLDIGGNVNAYYSHNSCEKTNNAIPALATKGSAIVGGVACVAGNSAAGTDDTRTTITTGLLPSFLSVSGKTRQNDLDVGFTISIQPGVATDTSLNTAGQENRQSFLTFGDKSWGSIKMGRDLGIFGSTAILSDMTLLGVGAAGQNRTGTTTLGGIGTGYLYADWKAQVSYASPNWNGFSFTAGVMQPWDTSGASPLNGSTSRPGFEGQATYEWAGDVSGKVWVGGIYQKVEDVLIGGISVGDETARGFDVGATVNVAGFGLTGYYYDGKGIGTTGFLANALDATGKRRDSDGGYVQVTYTIPGAGTKLGVSYGVSNLDKNAADALVNLVDSNDRWTVGAYHPLTKHLNLVAEYNDVSSESHLAGIKDNDHKNLSLGAILFF